MELHNMRHSGIVSIKCDGAAFPIAQNLQNYSLSAQTPKQIEFVAPTIKLEV